jgi:hypothetical protein
LTFKGLLGVIYQKVELFKIIYSFPHINSAQLSSDADITFHYLYTCVRKGKC